MSKKIDQTPWCVGAQNDALYIVVGKSPAMNNDYPVHDAERTVIAKVYELDKANIIVKAVNCHDQLVEALERAQEELRLINMKDTGAIYDVGLRTAINAALKAAKG